MDKEQELRPSPCPFCGGKAKTVRYHAHSVVVRCTSCECEGPDVSANETEAIAAWNRRPSDEQAEVVEEAGVPCERCQGNGELVTDWERYKRGETDSDGEEFVRPCPDCDGTGRVDAPPAVAAGGVTEELVEASIAAMRESLGYRHGNIIHFGSHHIDLRILARAALTAALAVRDEGIREGAKDTIDYVMQYGGRCRDCADENGTCPHSGLPCDTDAASKVIGFVLRAVDYGQRHGYLPTPPSRGEVV